MVALPLALALAAAGAVAAFAGCAVGANGAASADKAPALAQTQAAAAAPRVARPSSGEGAAGDEDADDATEGTERQGANQGAGGATLAAPARPVLDHPQALHAFFEALARLDDAGGGGGSGSASASGGAGAGHDDVHVVQLGDSHTAADVETGALRRVLQARFGDGGRGFVAIGRPWKTYFQEGIRGGMTREWAGEHGKLTHGQFTGDGEYGLAGYAIQTTRKNGRAWTEIFAPTSRVELAFLTQPHGGSVDFLVDGARTARVTTRGKSIDSGFRAFDVTEGSHRVEVISNGDGPVRLFGLALDRASTGGVVVDAAGINGERAVNTLSWNEAHMAAQLRHRSPELVVLAYGTNESSDDTTASVYERQLVDVLGRVARAVPSASCLLLGPPDRALRGEDGVWTTSAKLLEVIESQRRVADAAGCAFFDQLTAMGGPGTITQWAEEQPPRARHDHTHLTREGYTQLGQAFGGELLKAYAAWRAETGRPPIAAPPSPGAPLAPPFTPPAGPPLVSRR